MDTVDAATRSRIMASVGGKNTLPELRLRKSLHALGFRYRLHRRGLPGSPDIVLPKFKAVIFVHGCFWHAHGCRLSKLPSTRTEFWEAKFQTNKARDERNVGELLAKGWRVAVVWQCSLTKDETVLALAAELAGWLKGNDSKFESVLA